MTPRQKTNLQRLLRPRHIAFVGGDDAASAANQCVNGGFDGQIWGVNPKRSNLGQHPCFKHVENLPEPPDATFLAIPRRQAPEVIGQLAQIGASGNWLRLGLAASSATQQGSVNSETMVPSSSVNW